VKKNNKKELFIVEGQSAASTLRQAIKKSDQTILAVQGKLINVTTATSEKIHANQECQKIFQSLACGTAKKCNPDQLPYSRILILTDPDIDGLHSRALVLTLFDQYLKPLLDSRLIAVILPPLFRITWKETEEKCYAWDEQERYQLIGEKANEFYVTRFKGIAQFTKEECEKFLLEPQTRKQINLE